MPTVNDAAYIRALIKQIRELTAKLQQERSAVESLRGICQQLVEAYDFDDWAAGDNALEDIVQMAREALADTHCAWCESLDVARRQERDRIGRAIIERGLWTQELSEAVLAAIREED